MKKTIFIICFIASICVVKGQQKNVFVFVHGAWGGAWDWKEVAHQLNEKGEQTYRITLTGLGERKHLINKSIGLETHILDVVNTILFEDLQNVILVGHSYGGMVITGVAQRIPNRIKKLIYIDALLPNDGESLITAFPENKRRKPSTDSVIIPTWVKAEQLPPFDVPHPSKTFTDIISIKNIEASKIPAAYILTVDKGKNADEDDFSFFAKRAKERNFAYIQMDNTSHIPERESPKELAKILLSLNP